MLSIGGDTGFAYYSGDGSSAVAQPFSYTVDPLERDADGVSLRADSLDLYDGTIRATDDSADATLTHPGMAFPGHKVAAGSAVTVGSAQVGIPGNAELDNDDRSTTNEVWEWQRSDTEAATYTDIPAAEGGTSTQYTPSAGDLGKWLKATVTYDDVTGTDWTGERITNVLSQPTVSNASYGDHNFVGYSNNDPVTHRYAQGFTTGAHMRGYRLTAVRLALFLTNEEDTVGGAWGVHGDDAGKPAAAPLSPALPFLGTDLNENVDHGIFQEFTHPEGVLLQPNTKYWIVISQTTPTEDGNIGVSTLDERFAETLIPVEVTDSEDVCTRPVVPDSEEEEEYPCKPSVDPGSEDGWWLEFEALAHYWENPSDPVIPFDPDDPDAYVYPDPALLPWHYLADAMQLPRRTVLRMSLVAPPVVTVQFGASDYTVDEGNSVSVEVELSSDPKSAITIPITTMGEGGATSADYSGVPQSVTFNRGETTKTVTFPTTQDAVDDDGESVKLAFGSMPHSGVSAVTPNETTVNITDDDHPEVEVEFGASAYTVAEGASQSITVTLKADPERTLIIPIEATGQDGATAADYSVPSSVTFNDGEMEKSFTFTATQDNIDDDNESVQLGFGTMPDTRVSLGTTDDVTLSITDDDTAALVVSRASLTVGESASSSYTVKLDTEPTASVTVTISGHAGTDLTLSGTTLTNNALTFTAANWNTAQTVTVTAAHDGDGVPDDATLTHTASGGGYAGLTDELSVTVTDDDTPAVVLTPGEIAMEESQEATYTVKLATEPTVTVTVTISGHAGTDLTLSGTTLTNDALTFTSTNWDTAQTVTVMGAHDTDSISDVETLTHTASGGEYAGVESTLRVAVNDDDTGALRLVDGNLTDENGRLCEGRLEIFYNGAWGTICDDYWTKDDADVACRALGFVAPVEDYNRYRTAYFGPGTAEREIVLDDLNCNGDESGLLECPSGQPGPGIHNCRHSEDVGLRCLKVGQSPPWIIDVEFGGPPGGNGAYDAGETLEATLVWSEPVTISTPSGGLLPKVWVVYGSGASGHTDIAEYASGSGTDRTVFRYTLQSGSYSLVGVAYNSLRVRDGSIVSLESGLDAELGHSSYFSAQSENQAEAVTIIGVPAFNDPGPDNAWGAGEAVEVTFTFSRPVQVDTTGGAPSLPVLLSGTASRQALYLGGSGTDAPAGVRLHACRGGRDAFISSGCARLPGPERRLHQRREQHAGCGDRAPGCGGVLRPAGCRCNGPGTPVGRHGRRHPDTDLQRGTGHGRHAARECLRRERPRVAPVHTLRVGVGLRGNADPGHGGGGGGHSGGCLRRAHGRVGEQAAGRVEQRRGVLQRAGGHEQHRLVWDPENRPAASARRPGQPEGCPARKRQAPGVLGRPRFRPHSHRLHPPVEGVGGRLE